MYSKWFFALIITTSFLNCVKPSVITFKKVTLWKSAADKFATIWSFNSLKKFKNLTGVRELKFTKTLPVEKRAYSVMLQLNDTNLINGNNTVTAPIDLHFPNQTGYHPELYKKQMKPVNLYPSNKVKIFRTAAPLARLTQPSPKNLNWAKHFTVKQVLPKDRDIFNVTYSGGIVFVHDSGNLRNASQFVRLTISWSDINNTKKFDEIEVQIVDEPTKTCTDMVYFGDWISCSEFRTPEKCLYPKSCALSTGGSASVAKRKGPQRCMWRGEWTPSNESTTLYSTCTPDDDTCPDEVCDELEQLHDSICPQDCTGRCYFQGH